MPLAINEGEHYEVDVATGCWMWKRRFGPYGYGTMSRKIEGRERIMQAHRVSYELNIGPIVEGREIHHLCETKACVNPEHLMLVSPLEHHRIPNGQVKLTWSRVREIRRRYAAGEAQNGLARSFGVHPAHISRIVNNKLWAE